VITTTALIAVIITSGISTVTVIPERRVDIPVAFVIATIAVPAGLIGALCTVAIPHQAFSIGFAVQLDSIALHHPLPHCTQLHRQHHRLVAAHHRPRWSHPPCSAASSQ
jgi:uncharacterized membrane protein YfcA